MRNVGICVEYIKKEHGHALLHTYHWLNPLCIAYAMTDWWSFHSVMDDEAIVPGSGSREL